MERYGSQPRLLLALRYLYSRCGPASWLVLQTAAQGRSFCVDEKESHPSAGSFKPRAEWREVRAVWDGSSSRRDVPKGQEDSAQEPVGFEAEPNGSLLIQREMRLGPSTGSLSLGSAWSKSH
jgi:hypothetical protein